MLFRKPVPMPSSSGIDATLTDSGRKARSAVEPVTVLKLLYSGGEGLSSKEYLLNKEGLTIGRRVSESETSSLELPADSRLSRVHAQIRFQDQRFLIADNDSRNHTYVNGQRVSSAWLADGDVIRVGHSLLLFRQERYHTRDAPPEARPLHASLLGGSPAMRTLRAQLAKAALRPDAVLLLGETGTGKELAAHALHACSGRPGRLISRNVADIPPSLAASTLFGHERNSFTGAQKHVGLFAEAQQGTLFLDEIGELSLDMQPLLLRALEEGSIRPIGGKLEKIDVRFVSATNRDLDHAISTDRFRSDLRARLAVLTIALPPLRERREDILPLFMHFLGRPCSLDPEVCEALLRYTWPENVRELRSVTKQLNTWAADTELLKLEDLPPSLQRLAQAAVPTTARAKAEPLRPPHDSPARVVPPSREQLLALLRQHEGHRTHVAEALDLSRRQLNRYLQKWALHQQFPDGRHRSPTASATASPQGEEPNGTA